jgi:hypothetical protein
MTTGKEFDVKHEADEALKNLNTLIKHSPPEYPLGQLNPKPLKGAKVSNLNT